MAEGSVEPNKKTCDDSIVCIFSVQLLSDKDPSSLPRSGTLGVSSQGAIFFLAEDEEFSLADITPAEVQKTSSLAAMVVTQEGDLLFIDFKDNDDLAAFADLLSTPSEMCANETICTSHVFSPHQTPTQRNSSPVEPQQLSVAPFISERPAATDLPIKERSTPNSALGPSLPTVAASFPPRYESTLREYVKLKSASDNTIEALQKLILHDTCTSLAPYQELVFFASVRLLACSQSPSTIPMLLEILEHFLVSYSPLAYELVVFQFPVDRSMMLYSDIITHTLEGVISAKATLGSSLNGSLHQLILHHCFVFFHLIEAFSTVFTRAPRSFLTLKRFLERTADLRPDMLSSESYEESVNNLLEVLFSALGKCSSTILGHLYTAQPFEQCFALTFYQDSWEPALSNSVLAELRSGPVELVQTVTNLSMTMALIVVIILFHRKRWANLEVPFTPDTDIMHIFNSIVHIIDLDLASIMVHFNRADSILIIEQAEPPQNGPLSYVSDSSGCIADDVPLLTTSYSMGPSASLCLLNILLSVRVPFLFEQNIEYVLQLLNYCIFLSKDFRFVVLLSTNSLSPLQSSHSNPTAPNPLCMGAVVAHDRLPTTSAVFLELAKFADILVEYCTQQLDLYTDDIASTASLCALLRHTLLAAFGILLNVVDKLILYKEIFACMTVLSPQVSDRMLHTLESTARYIIQGSGARKEFFSFETIDSLISLLNAVSFVFADKEVACGLHNTCFHGFITGTVNILVDILQVYFEDNVTDPSVVCTATELKLLGRPNLDALLCALSFQCAEDSQIEAFFLRYVGLILFHATSFLKAYLSASENSVTPSSSESIFTFVLETAETLVSFLSVQLAGFAKDPADTNNDPYSTASSSSLCLVWKHVGGLVDYITSLLIEWHSLLSHGITDRAMLILNVHNSILCQLVQHSDASSFLNLLSSEGDEHDNVDFNGGFLPSDVHIAFCNSSRHILLLSSQIPRQDKVPKPLSDTACKTLFTLFTETICLARKKPHAHSLNNILLHLCYCVHDIIIFYKTCDKNVYNPDLLIPMGDLIIRYLCVAMSQSVEPLGKHEASEVPGIMMQLFVEIPRLFLSIFLLLSDVSGSHGAHDMDDSLILQLLFAEPAPTSHQIEFLARCAPNIASSQIVEGDGNHAVMSNYRTVIFGAFKMDSTELQKFALYLCFLLSLSTSNKSLLYQLFCLLSDARMQMYLHHVLSDEEGELIHRLVVAEIFNRVLTAFLSDSGVWISRSTIHKVVQPILSSAWISSLLGLVITIEELPHPGSERISVLTHVVIFASYRTLLSLIRFILRQIALEHEKTNSVTSSAHNSVTVQVSKNASTLEACQLVDVLFRCMLLHYMSDTSSRNHPVEKDATCSECQNILGAIEPRCFSFCPLCIEAARLLLNGLRLLCLPEHSTAVSAHASSAQPELLSLDVEESLLRVLHFCAELLETSVCACSLSFVGSSPKRYSGNLQCIHLCAHAVSFASQYTKAPRALNFTVGILFSLFSTNFADISLCTWPDYEACSANNSLGLMPNLLSHDLCGPEARDEGGGPVVYKKTNMQVSRIVSSLFYTLRSLVLQYSPYAASNPLKYLFLAFMFGDGTLTIDEVATNSPLSSRLSTTSNEVVQTVVACVDIVTLYASDTCEQPREYPTSSSLTIVVRKVFSKMTSSDNGGLPNALAPLAISALVFLQFLLSCSNDSSHKDLVRLLKDYPASGITKERVQQYLYAILSPALPSLRALIQRVYSKDICSFSGYFDSPSAPPVAISTFDMQLGILSMQLVREYAQSDRSIAIIQQAGLVACLCKLQDDILKGSLDEWSSLSSKSSHLLRNHILLFLEEMAKLFCICVHSRQVLADKTSRRFILVDLARSLKALSFLLSSNVCKVKTHSPDASPYLSPLKAFALNTLIAVRGLLSVSSSIAAEFLLLSQGPNDETSAVNWLLSIAAHLFETPFNSQVNSSHVTQDPISSDMDESTLMLQTLRCIHGFVLLTKVLKGQKAGANPQCQVLLITHLPMITRHVMGFVKSTSSWIRDAAVAILQECGSLDEY